MAIYKVYDDAIDACFKMLIVKPNSLIIEAEWAVNNLLNNSNEGFHFANKQNKKHILMQLASPYIQT